MQKLKLAPNIEDADGAYQSLIDAHSDLSDAQSAALNARLILLLINHIGDRQVIEEAIVAAKKQSSAATI